MDELHLFSVKNKPNLDKNETFLKNINSYKCFFICSDKLILFKNKKFFLLTYNIANFNIKKEDTYFLAKNKNTFIVGFSITTNKLKKIYNNNNFSLMSLRDSINIVNKNVASYLSSLYSLNKWRKNNKFCSKCGQKNLSLSYDNSLVCTNKNCNNRIFPRIDPTVIILIKYKNNILLARDKNWKKNLYSCIAGFCEPNESLEETVYRETFEEVGLNLKKVNYLFSQFWPFTNNLMIGFEAIANNKELKINKSEIEKAIWVTKSELINLKRKKEIILPRKYAIAYSLIQYWLKN